MIFAVDAEKMPQYLQNERLKPPFPQTSVLTLCKHKKTIKLKVCHLLFDVRAFLGNEGTPYTDYTGTASLN